MKAVIRLVLFSSLIAACGGGSSSPGDDDDTPPTDSSNPQSDGPVGGACTAESSYSAASATAEPGVYACETAGCAVSDADVVFVDGTLNADATPDLISIELWKGSGAFTTAITTGTFQITGEEANYATCGACALIYTDRSDTGIVDTYMATAGTITITTLTPMISGTIENATFTHVTIDEKTAESAPVGDCDSAATGTYTFNVAATELPQE